METVQRPSSDTFARVRAPDDDLSKAIDNLNDNDLAALVGGEIPGPSLPPFPVPMHTTMSPLGSRSYRNKDLAVKRQDHEPLIHINITDLCRRFLKIETKEKFSKDQEGDFMRSHVPSCSKVNFEMILAGRKCYRMSKEKNEVVWPPHLEQALMEGPLVPRSLSDLFHSFCSDRSRQIHARRIQVPAWSHPLPKP